MSGRHGERGGGGILGSVNRGCGTLGSVNLDGTLGLENNIVCDGNEKI